MPNGDDGNGKNLETQFDQPEVGNPTPVIPPLAMAGTLAGGLAQASGDALGSVGPQLPQQQPAPPAMSQPVQKPVFFQKVLGTLGLGLVNAVRAGLETPRGPNAFGQAATTAFDLPARDALLNQARRTEMTRQQALQSEFMDAPTMSKLRMAQAQINLQTSQAMLRKMDEEYQWGAGNDSVAFFQKLIEEGNAEVIGGLHDTLGEAQQAANTDHASSGQGLSTVAVPISGKNGKYQFAAVRLTPKRTLGTDTRVDIDYAEDLGVKSIHETLPATMDSKEALARAAQLHKDYAVAAQLASRQKIVEIQQKGATGRALIADAARRAKIAADTVIKGDQLDEKATADYVKSAKNYGDVINKYGMAGRALDTITGEAGRQITGAKRAMDISEQKMNDIRAKRGGATPAAGGGNVAPEGTVITLKDGSKQVKRNGQWVPQ